MVKVLQQVVVHGGHDDDMIALLELLNTTPDDPLREKLSSNQTTLKQTADNQNIANQTSDTQNIADNQNIANQTADNQNITENQAMDNQIEGCQSPKASNPEKKICWTMYQLSLKIDMLNVSMKWVYMT